MQGVGLSQVALDWGCDDLDGTVVWYDITKRQGVNGASGGGSGEAQRQEVHVSLEKLIRDAGREPVERDTLYRPIERDEAARVANAEIDRQEAPASA